MFASILLYLCILTADAQRVPPLEESYLSFGSAMSETLPREVDLLLWNVFKGRRELVWQTEFYQLAFDKKMILIQEAMTQGVVWEAMNFFNFQWHYGISFYDKTGNANGVALGSIARSIFSGVIRSAAREPLVRTPKMTNINYYKLSNGEDLLVANIHAINFVRNSYFRHQIYEIVKVLETHNGPIIFAGDFNTHNSGRMNFLMAHLCAIGLKIAKLKDDNRGVLKLDHIFYRDIELVEAQIHMDYNGSDHYPITAKFRTLN